MELTHQEALSFNELNEKDLPVGLKVKLGKLNVLIRKYEAEPTDALKAEIESKSANLAHDIADYAEKDKEYEPEQTNQNKGNHSEVKNGNEEVEIIDSSYYLGKKDEQKPKSDNGFWGGFLNSFGF